MPRGVLSLKGYLRNLKNTLLKDFAYGIFQIDDFEGKHSPEVTSCYVPFGYRLQIQQRTEKGWRVLKTFPVRPWPKKEEGCRQGSFLRAELP
jgi:hypothetical protein